MPLPIVYRYEEDGTGLSPNNLAIHEPVTLTGSGKRVHAAQYGAFFAESVTIIDVATGDPLTSSQWKPVGRARTPTNKYGKGIYYCICILDSSVSNNLLVTRQYLGGLFEYSFEALVEGIERAMNDERMVQWNDIQNKPFSFNPSMGYQDANNIYGTEYTVEAIERVRMAISMDNYEALALMYDRVMNVANSNGDDIEALRAELMTSVNDLAAQVTAYAASIATLPTTVTTQGLQIAVLTALVGALTDLNISSRLTAAEGSITTLNAANLPARMTAAELATTGIINSKTSLTDPLSSDWESTSLITTPKGVWNLLKDHSISSDNGNQLSWHTNGLYIGATAPANVATLYVDAVDGLDTNTGTKLLPMKTIEAALARGPAGILRSIRLMEGQNHEVRSTNPGILRGGRARFTVYGPTADSLPIDSLDTFNLGTTIDCIPDYVYTANDGFTYYSRLAMYGTTGGVFRFIGLTLHVRELVAPGVLTTNSGALHSTTEDAGYEFLRCNIQLDGLDAILFPASYSSPMVFRFGTTSFTTNGNPIAGKIARVMNDVSFTLIQQNVFNTDGTPRGESDVVTLVDPIITRYDAVVNYTTNVRIPMNVSLIGEAETSRVGDYVISVANPGIGYGGHWEMLGQASSVDNTWLWQRDT